MTAAPALYRIAVASRMSGVAEHTLRVWDRRYGSLASHRTEAGYRLYTPEDVERLRRLRELVDAGHAIGEIAKLPLRDLKKLGKPSDGRAGLGRIVASEARRRFTAAVDVFDLPEAARVMGTARAAFSPLELVTDVIAPLLAELGQRWIDEPNNSIAQEHVATVVLRDELTRLLVSARPRPDGPRVAIAAPEAELHEFGALIAAVVSADAGANVLYLGPNLPASDLALAAKMHRATIVLLSLVSLERKQASRYVTRLRAALDADVRVWIGGAAAEASPSKGIERVGSLEQLQALLRE